jgi:CDP-diglyceride synthetase
MILTPSIIFEVITLPVSLIMVYQYIVFKKEKISKNIFKYRMILLSLVLIYSLLLYIFPTGNITTFLSISFFLLSAFLSVKMKEQFKINKGEKE